MRWLDYRRAHRERDVGYVCGASFMIIALLSVFGFDSTTRKQ
jgi:hypothetical protein